MDFDLDMQAALEADGAKLRQLTGEDHGPWSFEPEVAEAPCPYCFESSGYRHRIVYGGWSEPDYAEPDPTDPCPICCGTGTVPSDSITLDDLADRCGDFEP